MTSRGFKKRGPAPRAATGQAQMIRLRRDEGRNPQFPPQSRAVLFVIVHVLPSVVETMP
jgi:hypothetical protein